MVSLKKQQQQKKIGSVHTHHTNAGGIGACMDASFFLDRAKLQCTHLCTCTWAYTNLHYMYFSMFEEGIQAYASCVIYQMSYMPNMHMQYVN